MYLLKQLPSDFIVREIPKLKITESGRYLYLTITKKNKNTLDVVKQLAKILHLPDKDIGFAGNKDKNAITEQVFSVKGGSKERISKIEIPDLKIECVGYGTTPLSLGDLEGNQFEITIRNLEKEKIQKVDYIPNYFDEQRFASNNAAIGKHIIKKEFSKALELMNYSQCTRYLETHKNDFVGALQLIPMRLLKMYVNAYQSLLWNETVAQYLKEEAEVQKEEKYSVGTFIFIHNPDKFLTVEIPLIGCGDVTSKNKKINEIMSKILQKEDITSADFVIKQIKELTQMGEMRKAFIEVKDLKTGKFQSDELNPEKKKVSVSFSLGKGSYATMVIRAVVED
ncbi:MAG: tRNA pseudouridine(13) synthase TruD [Nanoarchaeota archaeon]|nr:tRNA pseudouridine(13) synthase TruD [Nanoarchaeota archaeon]